MESVVIPFPHGRSPITEVAQYLRIGEHHRVFGDLRAEGYLPVKRVVVQASQISKQSSLLSILRNEGVEIILDFEAAELSSLYRFRTQVKAAPWVGSELERPLETGDFTSERISAMARLAVQCEVDAVLSPAHFLMDPHCGEWFEADRRSCESLRLALDRAGGGHIAIDYPVISTISGLADQRENLAQNLCSLPVEQVWFRISGIGKHAGPQKTQALIRQLARFHNLGMPTVLDYCNGINAEAAIAFGAVSGVSFGILERDHFDASKWHKPMPEREPSGSFGRKKYVAAPGLSRTFEVKEFELLARAKGGRRLLLESGFDLEQTIKNRKGQAARQSVQSYERLERVPDLNRAKFYIDKSLHEVVQRSRDVSRLNPSQAAADAAGVNIVSLKKRTTDHYETMEKVRASLERLYDETGHESPRARPCRKQEVATGEARKDQK